MSTEVGYQRAIYSPGTWTWEICLITDKTVERWYLAFNPALEHTWHVPDVKQGLGFSPSVKISYDFTRQINVGLGHYADYGRIGAFDALHDQQQICLAKWEINIGVGVGPTTEPTT